MTPFSDIYAFFDSKVTDDMFMEMDREDTEKEFFRYLQQAINWFEFPRNNLSDYEITKDKDAETGIVTVNGYFNADLTNEEKNILAVYMVVAWLTQQIQTVDNTRLKYSGSDFKFTSQANHIAKLLSLKKDYEREGFHLQRLYERRDKDSNGKSFATFGTIMASSIGARDKRKYEKQVWVDY